MGGVGVGSGVRGEENQKVATEVELLLEKGVNGERHTHHCRKYIYFTLIRDIPT